MAARSLHHDKKQTVIYKNVREPTQQDAEYDELDFVDQPLEGNTMAKPEQSTNNQPGDKIRMERRIKYSVRKALIIGFVLQMVMVIAISSFLGFHIISSHREPGSQVPTRSNSSDKGKDKGSVDEERQKFEEKIVSTVTSEVKALRGEIETLIKNSVNEEIKKLEEKMMATFTSKIDAVRGEIRTLNKSGSVAFFVHSPNGTTMDSRPFFKDIITNIGGGYHQNQAKFMCPKSGIYSFSVAFRTTGKMIDCYMTKNGNTLAFIGTDGDVGYYNMASQSVYVQLSVGDIFALGGCVNWQDVHGAWGSSFSGALIG